MPRSPKPSSQLALIPPRFPPPTQAVGLTFSLQAVESSNLYPQYTIGLHAWFLDQIRQIDPALSAYLHDGESEKPFTITGLSGQFRSHSQQLQLQAGKIYEWQVTALSKPVVQGIAKWLKRLPDAIILKNIPLQIQSVDASPAPVTYDDLWQQSIGMRGSVRLNFLTPTSFRRKGNHFPLPVPVNLFHSYLRRWNDFSGMPFDQNTFLEWIETHVVIQQVQMESMKVAAGKRGSVTGFTGSVSLSLTTRAQKNPEFQHLFYALALFAPYCGTGHKTTFGLGQTALGGTQKSAQIIEMRTSDEVLAERIAELSDTFLAQRKRQGGDRARLTAETWATILARREMGESLLDIAGDLDMPYETVKTYAKLARRALRSE